MVLETIDDLATALIGARTGGPVIDTVPDHLVPADLDAVARLQDLIIEKIGPVGGWKVMAGGEGEPACAPIPANRYFADGETISSTLHRFVLAEVEVAVKLGKDLAGGADLATVEAAIESLHPALEMIASPFANRDAMAHFTKLGDLQSNGAVIVGPALDEAVKDELSKLPAALLLDGATVKTGDSGASWTAVLEAVQWLAGHAAARGMPLAKGQVIITGSRVLAPQLTAKSLEGQLGNWGSVTVSLSY